MLDWLFPRRHWPSLTLDQIRSRARILVIDDDPFRYLDMFTEAHYRIEQWLDVTSLASLEQEDYDIILLDIADVGKKISGDEGLGVLKAVRSVSPTQIIVAYSNKEFSLRLKQFLNLATDSIDKNVTDYADCKATIDKLLHMRFSLSWYVDQVIDQLREQTRDAQKLRKQTEKAILHRNPRYFENRVHPHTDTEKTAVAISLRHIRSAIGVLERCHGS
ncbi:MAG: hypothetical protein QOE82_1756 [Thermoanaerobaculia bacterium]|jgi:CheY-like chemotaxis protein|nr:hypothetical protein [Thermoanaerobaculia bacterium]